ncbi:MAG: hypothetical protein ACTSPP_00280 [Candidatus Heimdallarchaeaceae archaeon]
MVIQEESKDIIEDSPFNRLVLAEMERERLYSTFALVDEFNEIASSWLEFSDFCAKSLFNLTNLSFLLYERYLDEFNRDKQQIEINFERKSFIIKRIENLQQFQMEAAILMILYADIVNTGIFESKPAENFCYLNIEGYKVLEKISSTYFDSTHPRSSSIEDIMVKLFTISQKVQIVKILNDSPIKKAKEPSFIQEQLELERLLASFEFDFIAKLIEELGKRWWWYDPIAIHFSYERAMKHIEKSLSLLEYSEENVLQIKEEIKNKISTIDKIWRNKALIDHFYRITLEAAKKDNFVASIEYLNLILGLIDEIIEYFQNNNVHLESEEQFYEEIEERKNDLKVFHIVVRLAFSVAEIINKQTSIDKALLEEKLTEIEKICKDSSLFSNINYFSEIVYVYQGFVQTARIGILKKQKTEKILNNAIAQFEYYIVKLENSLTKIANDFYKKVHKGTLKSTDFKNYLKKIEELKYISFFLPNLEQKLNLTREIESMECYIKSIAALKQSQSQELSEIEKLIYYSKAHYFSNKALDLSQSKEKAIIPDSWLEEQFLKTFTEGREVELKLFELSRQFLFLNKVIDEIAYCFDISEKKKEKIENYETVLQFHFRKFELFEIINRQIEENCLESLKYREISNDIVIIDKNVNWQIIEAKKILASSADKLIKALKKCALGYAADRNKDNYKAAVLFNEGYKLVQEACNILDPLTTYDKQFADLAKTTYEFNLFLKELERLELEKKKIKEFPLEKVLSLVKKIIFFS